MKTDAATLQRARAASAAAPRAPSYAFRAFWLRRVAQDQRFKVTLSYMEIYNERIKVRCNHASFLQIVRE